MDFCSSHSHQLSFDHTCHSHRCVGSCRFCIDQGVDICALWRDNASVDLDGGCCVCLERGVFNVHRHFNSRYLWNRTSFCTVCNSGDCRVQVSRHKALYTSSELAEMQLSSSWHHFGGHVDVNHKNDGTLLSGI